MKSPTVVLCGVLLGTLLAVPAGECLAASPAPAAACQGLLGPGKVGLGAPGAHPAEPGASRHPALDTRRPARSCCAGRAQSEGGCVAIGQQVLGACEQERNVINQHVPLSSTAPTAQQTADAMAALESAEPPTEG